MTDRRPGRSSICVDEEPAALDLKQPGHSIFSTGADGSQPEHGVVGRGPRPGGGLDSEARVLTRNKEHASPHSRPTAPEGAMGAKTGPRHIQAGAEVRRCLDEREEYAPRLTARPLT